MNLQTTLIIGGMAVLILLICVIVLFRFYLKSKNSFQALEESYRQLETLNTSFKAQRHDQLNHLQVVYGLLQLGEYDEAEKYLQPLFKELQKTGRAVKTSSPGFNAMLMAKGIEAESRGIDFFVEVKSDLKNLPIPDWELCRVLSNLADNAMTALESRDKDRRLWFDISESEDDFRFEVANNGPEIRPDMRETIFVRGFTTKQGSGHGMGLDIVRRTAASWGGTVSLLSDTERTSFTVRIPKQSVIKGEV